MKIFGCPAYTHVDNGILEPRSIKCAFLGFKSSVKGYISYRVQKLRKSISKDVIFYETTMLHDSSSRDSYDKEQEKSNT